MLRSLDHTLDPIDPEDGRDLITEVRRRGEHETTRRPLSVSVPLIGVLAGPRRLPGPMLTAAEPPARPQPAARRAAPATAGKPVLRALARHGEVAETMHWRRELLVLP